MYLHLLSNRQQEAFWRAACLLVGADGRSEGTETRWLDAARREMRMIAAPRPARDLDEVLGELPVYDSPLARRVMLLELISAALSDGQVAPIERSVIEEICGNWGVSSDHLEQLQRFAVRARDLLDEGYQLIAD